MGRWCASWEGELLALVVASRAAGIEYSQLMSRSVHWVVRAAVPKDAPAIAALLGELGYPVDSESVRARMGRLSNESDAVLVVDSGDEAAAVATVHLIPLFHRDSFLARITAFVVSNRVRHQGVGSALIQACEAWAAGNGAERAEVTSSDKRDGAHEFYTRRGFEREGVRFSKRL